MNIPNSSAGSKVWGTNLSGQYNINEDSYLESNCFDFSNLTEEPYLSFSLNYATENCCDEGWVEYSTDGGSIWNKVLGSPDSENWYNNLGSQWWNGTSGGWVIAKTRLSGVMDSTDVRFRFVFSSDGSAQENGFYIDNFLLYTEINDAGVSNAQLPLANCDLPNNYTVSGIFNNYGTDTLYGYEVCYSLNEANSICEMLSDTVAPGEVDSFNFSTPIDLSANGNYELLVFSNLPNDFLAGNDTFRISTTNKDDISVFPYQQDFENGTASWISEGVNSSWALSLPQNSTIQGAASGQNAWVTNPNGNYNNNETSYVYSPCFDFTTQQPGLWVGLNIWWDTEQLWDGAVLQYSIDSQTTWNTIGATGDPFNWYNSNSFNLNPGGSNNGWAGLNASGSGSYVWAQSPLDTAVFGEENVVFRIAFDSDGSNNYNGIAFDDFTIGEIPSPQILSDTVVCSGTTVSTNLPNFKHSWSTGDTTSQTVLVNTSSAPIDVELIVEVKNSFGFVQYDTLEVRVNPGPYFDLGNDATLCYDECLDIGADLEAFIYSWNTGSNSDSLTVCNSSSFETFILTASDSSSSCSYSDTVNLQFTNQVDLGNDTAFCAGESLDFELNPTLWDSAVWSNGSTGVVTNTNNPGQIWVVATDNFGCISSDTIDITENSAPQINLGTDTVLCDTTSLILEVIAGNYDYEWTLNSSVIGNTQSININSSGNYEVTLTTSEGCTSSDSKLVTFENCTGVEAFLEENELGIYPNPSDGQFYLSIEGEAVGKIQIQVIDLSGKEVLNINDEKSAQFYKRTFDLEDLNKGVYFLNIKHKDVVLNEKIVIQ